MQKSVSLLNQVDFQMDSTNKFGLQLVQFSFLRYLYIFRLKRICNGRFSLSTLLVIQKR